jgi:hypothetical protein
MSKKIGMLIVGMAFGIAGALSLGTAGNDGVARANCEIVYTSGSITIPVRCSFAIDENGIGSGNYDAFPTTCGTFLTYDCSKVWVIEKVPTE